MIEQWVTDFQTLADRPPAEGDILRAYGNEDVRLDVVLETGKPPFIFGTCYVPSIVGHPLGWFLHATSSTKPRGMKCILLPKSREESVRRLGLSSTPIAVRALRVVRPSASNTSLLCEIAEWCTKEKEEAAA